MWSNAKLLKTDAERKRPVDTPLTTRAYNLGLKVVPNFAKALGEKEIAYYEKHLGEIQEAIQRGFVVPEQFVLIKDLGTITVPRDYFHPLQLRNFRDRIQYHFSYDKAITDDCFPNPSRRLKSGDKLHVRVFQRAKSRKTTYEEMMNFLREQKAVFTGAQGASLVFEQKREQLPKDRSYASFDELGRLWEEYEGAPWAPIIEVGKERDFRFGVHYARDLQSYGCPFLCFTEDEE